MYTWFTEVIGPLTFSVFLWCCVIQLPHPPSSNNLNLAFYHSHSYFPLLSCVPQFMLYTCPLSSVTFCAVLPTPPKVFGFVFKHPATFVNLLSFLFPCSSPQYHLLVFIIADAFCRERSLRGERLHLTVEALSHKIRLKRLILQRENVELWMRLNASGDVNEEAVGLNTHTVLYS
uniref:Uncharacterized protein n=1 Tax=Oncorhynchus tshawytscha TaxID=74940 RepID=A0A8C8ILN7_ONCTS